jgi:hypothetical protein
MTALLATFFWDRYLEPWIIGVPDQPLSVSDNPKPPTLNCADKRYGYH